MKPGRYGDMVSTNDVCTTFKRACVESSTGVCHKATSSLREIDMLQIDTECHDYEIIKVAFN